MRYNTMSYHTSHHTPYQTPYRSILSHLTHTHKLQRHLIHWTIRYTRSPHHITSHHTARHSTLHHTTPHHTARHSTSQHTSHSTAHITPHHITQQSTQHNVLVSQLPGMNPAPMPWILWGPGLPPEITGDSAGSTAMTFTVSLTDFKNYTVQYYHVWVSIVLVVLE